MTAYDPATATPIPGLPGYVLDAHGDVVTLKTDPPRVLKTTAGVYTDRHGEPLVNAKRVKVRMGRANARVYDLNLALRGLRAADRWADRWEALRS